MYYTTYDDIKKEILELKGTLNNIYHKVGTSNKDSRKVIISKEYQEYKIEYSFYVYGCTYYLNLDLYINNNKFAYAYFKTSNKEDFIKNKNFGEDEFFRYFLEDVFTEKIESFDVKNFEKVLTLADKKTNRYYYGLYVLKDKKGSYYISDGEIDEKRFYLIKVSEKLLKKFIDGEISVGRLFKNKGLYACENGVYFESTHYNSDIEDILLHIFYDKNNKKDSLLSPGSNKNKLEVFYSKILNR